MPLPQCPDPALVWIEQSVDCRMVAQAAQSVDAVHMAAELGRLDLVSVLLATLGIFLAVAAVGGFWVIRGAALHAARETARDESQRYLDREAGRLFDEAVRTQGGRPEGPDLGSARLDEGTILEGATELRDNGDGQVG